MRKILGGLMLALGGFLLVTAALGTFWAPGAVKKTPIDVNSMNLATGEAARLDSATGTLTPKPIYATSLSQVDSDVSTDRTALFVNTACAVFGVPADPTDAETYTCVDDTDPDLLTAGIDTFATDRVSALAVDSDLLPEGAVPHAGLVNKFPFDAEQTTYPFWDGTAGVAVDAVYDRTEDVDGVEAYVYAVSVADAPIEIGEGIPGTYDDAKEIFVEPQTGSILNQVDDQQRYLEDGTQVLDLQLSLTDDQVAANVASATESADSITLLTRTVPLVGLIGGLLLVGAGAFLVARARRRPEAVEPPARGRRAVPAGR